MMTSHTFAIDGGLSGDGAAQAGGAKHLGRVKDQPRPSVKDQVRQEKKKKYFRQVESVTRPENARNPAIPVSGKARQAPASCRLASRPGLQSGP